MIFIKKKKMRLHSGFLSFSLFKFPDHHLGHGTYLLRPSWDNSRSAKFRRLIMFISLLSLIRTRVRLRCLCWLSYWSILLAILRTCKKRALSIIWPGISYETALDKAALPTHFLTVGQSRVLNLWGSKLLIAWKGKLYFVSVTLDV